DDDGVAVEGLQRRLRAAEAEEPLGDDQVAGGADRQELRDALHRPEDDRLGGVENGAGGRGRAHREEDHVGGGQRQAGADQGGGPGRPAARDSGGAGGRFRGGRGGLGRSRD